MELYSVKGKTNYIAISQQSEMIITYKDVRRLLSVVCRLSSVNFSHFKLLLRNHWADWNQT